MESGGDGVFSYVVPRVHPGLASTSVSTKDLEVIIEIIALGTRTAFATRCGFRSHSGTALSRD
jgi:hypothetical protein